MRLSLTPILVAVELGFLFAIAARDVRRRAQSAMPVFVYLGWLVAYATLAGILGAWGLYVAEPVLATLPGLWLQVVTIAAVAGPVVVLPGLRSLVGRVVDGTPWSWLAWFHAMRIAALGTAYKTSIGEFPEYFELFVGVPDLIFGVSAVFVARRASQGAITARQFMAWNLIGALVIVPSAPILLQLGLPGPLYVFTSLPDARAVFTHPMALAPMFGVPLFVLVNLCVAWRLWARSHTCPRSPGV